MKNLYAHLFIHFFFASNLAFAQYPFGEINGFVRAANTGEMLSFVEVIIEGNGEIIEIETDFDGYFAVNGLRIGLYQVKFDYVGASSEIVENVLVKADKQTSINSTINTHGCGNLWQPTIVEYKAPLLKSDRIGTGKTFTKEEIQSMPIRNIEEIANLAANRL
ncbi:MAG: carboxypeptidase-like regulatory domain-containing protein [Chitinophagales bacterium]